MATIIPATHTPYLATLPSGQTVRFAMDTARAEAPILQLAWDDWELEEPAYSQWQTADARHSPHNAAMLLLRSGERDWYAAPHDNREDDDILAEIGAGLSVREANDGKRQRGALLRSLV